MARLVLQPAANPDAQRHYRDTVENAVPLDRLRPHLSAEGFRRLQQVYPGGAAWLWGATPGPQNTVSVESMSPGDLVLFYRRRHFFSKATITLIEMGERSLARELWGTNDQGDTWEHLFFLTQPEEISIDYHDLWEVARVGAEDMLWGLTVLTESTSARVVDAFDDLEFEVVETSVSENDYREAAFALDELDERRTVLTRTEQGFLREQLFGQQTVGGCGICGDQFPVEFLVAAHIKKRAECSADEKRDFNNIVMPMCRFGCDELFERGYVAVLGGQVVTKPLPKTTDRVQDHLHRISGRRCEFWGPDSKDYFAWHARHSGF